MVNQINRVYSVNNEVLAPLYRKVLALKKYFKSLKVVHVLREFNKEANSLAKEKLY